MKNPKITVLGNITEDGKRFYYESRFNEFLREWAGEKIIIKVEIQDKRDKSALIKYYYSVIVDMTYRKFKENGDHKSLKEVDVFLRNLYNEDFSLGDSCHYEELADFINFLNIWLLENMDVITYDVNSIIS